VRIVCVRSSVWHVCGVCLCVGLINLYSNRALKKSLIHSKFYRLDKMVKPGPKILVMAVPPSENLFHS
jgi:hypothetical protein